jgi:RimJ/RimL family protein N-acetyltransferase
MSEVLILQTSRENLELRQFATVADDAAVFNAINANREHLSQYGETTATSAPNLASVSRRNLRLGDEIRMSILDDNIFQGVVRASPSDDKKQVELGLWLIEKATGKGSATLALSALTKHVLPQYDRAFVRININNIKSQNVAERAGYCLIEVEHVLGIGEIMTYDHCS